LQYPFAGVAEGERAMTAQRRRFLKMLAAGAAGAAVAGCAPEPSNGGRVAPEPGAGKPGQRYRWRLVTAWPPGLPGFGTTAVMLADMLREASGGRLSVQVYAAGELVPAFEVFDAVSRGSVEMGHSAPAYWKGQAPATQLFTGFPFGMLPAEFNAWLAYGGGMELWRECYEPYGLVPFPGGNTGTQMGGWFRREIRSMEDFSGLKIRMPGLGGDVLRRLGATVVNLSGGELFTALQTGVIDATEWASPYNDLPLGLYQAAPYYYYPGWHEPAGAIEVIVNREALESLPADLQALIRTACMAVNHQMLSEFMARNVQALDILVNRHGVELRRFPNEVLEGLRRASGNTLDGLAAGDPLAARILKSYREFQQGVSGWQAISEGSYLSARDSRR